MAQNDLISDIGTYLNPDVMNKASLVLSESPGGIEKAMSAIIPTLLGGISKVASSEVGGTSKLQGLLTNVGSDKDVLKDLGGILSNSSQAQAAISSGQDVLHNLLGSKAQAASVAIAEYSGIRTSSASSLMSLATLVVMGVINKVQAVAGAGDLGKLLSSQSASVSLAVPDELARASAISDLVDGGPPGKSVAADGASGRARRRVPLLALLVAVLIGLALLVYWRGRSASATDALTLRNEQRIRFDGTSGADGAMWMDKADFLDVETGVQGLFFKSQDLSQNMFGISSSGLARDTTGFKHKHDSAGCATSGSVGATCTTTLTWMTPFADANYTVTCVGEGIAAGVPLSGGIINKASGAVVFRTVAATATPAQYTNIECIAAHD